MARSVSPTTAWLNGVSISSRVLSGVMIGLILLFLIPLVVPYVENAASFWYIRNALQIEQGISGLVKQSVPTKIAGKDMTRWIFIFAAFLTSGWLSTLSTRTHDRLEYIRFKRNIDEWREKVKLSDNSALLSPLNRKLDELKSAKRKDRDQLLREFIETKKKLDAMGRDLSFLAIDIVDSTGMKQGEERAIVEHDFREYKRYVEATLQSFGCLKSTWTPDGVMCCFTTVDAAVRAARQVINGLDAFNRSVKSMRRDFAVRCGVNTGFVYFDDAVPLEEMSDRVIDIAGHMQKHALPNTVCVAKPAIEPLRERNGFEPAGRVVDGYEVYEWKKG